MPSLKSFWNLFFGSPLECDKELWHPKALAVVLKLAFFWTKIQQIYWHPQKKMSHFLTLGVQSLPPSSASKLKIGWFGKASVPTSPFTKSTSLALAATGHTFPAREGTAAELPTPLGMTSFATVKFWTARRGDKEVLLHHFTFSGAVTTPRHPLVVSKCQDLGSHIASGPLPYAACHRSTVIQLTVRTWKKSKNWINLHLVKFARSPLQKSTLSFSAFFGGSLSDSC